MTNEHKRLLFNALWEDQSESALYELIIEQFEKLHLIIYAGIAITVIISVIILLNQRKIRKELRQLREMMEKTNGQEDISSN